MLSDFDMIQHSIKSKEITVIPIADVHLGAIEHCEKEWSNFCKYVSETPNVYITLGGDLINNSTRTSVANPFDETMRPREQKKMMVEYLRPIKDRILCAVSGNHEARTKKDVDMDITYDIMSKLDIEDLYRENVAYVQLLLGPSRGPTNSCESSFVLCVTHGTGGGIYTGATVNRNERFSNIVEGVDCFFVGHTHKGTVSKPSKLVVDRRHKKVYTRPVVVISSESWMKYGGYAARKMLLPSEVANPQMVVFNASRHAPGMKVIW